MIFTLDARLNAPEIELNEHQLRLAKELGLDIALRKKGGANEP